MSNLILWIQNLRISVSSFLQLTYYIVILPLLMKHEWSVPGSTLNTHKVPQAGIWSRNKLSPSLYKKLHSRTPFSFRNVVQVRWLSARAYQPSPSNKSRASSDIWLPCGKERWTSSFWSPRHNSIVPSCQLQIIRQASQGVCSRGPSDTRHQLLGILGSQTCNSYS